MSQRVLIVPGYGNSGATHWQSIWEAAKPGHWRRMKIEDWDHAVCDEWVAAIDREVTALGADTIIVAHSLGCLAVVHWAVRHAVTIRGALLVAVPDPSASAFPSAFCDGFSPVPSARLPFRSIVVASNDDPYGAISYAKSCARTWGSEFLDVGARGHLNAASRLDDWAEGYKLLQHFDVNTLT
ncbi:MULTISPECIES: alpha/beta hydrolase [Ralstonia solanacearum species complex]|uniref:alpha/beta hydrolase n=1 Tax=Ralstonia solanacearum species complex TaxID=3116862 RepID=UPI0009043F9A|nr:alpha/beta hydrolase [Ralstonia pseudosolanacearum]AZU55774.1 serine hydrolase family protein [Ralstonia solanacearum]MCK4121134.1 serine hydrolase family protein [Ralstonia pseudosolanacearum]MCK4139084.1 serine hydrolase family protein [Ralstonia pseudosolanacearum]QIK18371.1 serine hydrolase family protein [Ralstonia solanacearum]QKL70853.1 serine hydrolase family protein [Ralstonia solanacearum]